MYKKMLAILLSGVMMTTISACGSDTETVVGGDLTLVYAEVNPLDSIVGQTGTFFAEKVHELSNGSVTVQVQANGVLGSENVILDGILGGSDAVDMSRISAFALTNYGGQKSMLLSLPYTFVSREHFWNFANSDLADEFLREPHENGVPVRGIFYGEEGFRHFFAADEINSIEDLEGMKLRVANDPIMNGLAKGLGAVPTVLDYNELYSGLQSGIVDGAEQPVANYASKAFDEPAPNIILNGHTLGAIQVIISDNAWAKLSEEQQNAILEAGELTKAYNAQLSAAEEAKVIEALRAKGVNVVEVADKQPWIDASKAVIDEQVSDQMRPVYDEIVAMAP